MFFRLWRWKRRYCRDPARRLDLLPELNQMSAGQKTRGLAWVVERETDTTIAVEALNLLESVAPVRVRQLLRQELRMCARKLQRRQAFFIDHAVALWLKLCPDQYEPVARLLVAHGKPESYQHAILEVLVKHLEGKRHPAIEAALIEAVGDYKSPHDILIVPRLAVNYFVDSNCIAGLTKCISLLKPGGKGWDAMLRVFVESRLPTNPHLRAALEKVLVQIRDLNFAYVPGWAVLVLARLGSPEATAKGTLQFYRSKDYSNFGHVWDSVMGR